MVFMEVQLKSLEEVQKFVHACNKLDCEADLTCGRSTVDAKSILGIMTMDLSRKMKLILYTEEADRVTNFLNPFTVSGGIRIEQSPFVYQ